MKQTLQSYSATEDLRQIGPGLRRLTSSLQQVRRQVATAGRRVDRIEAKLGAAAYGTAATANDVAPPPAVLYQSGLSDYEAGRYRMAIEEFGEYLTAYPNARRVADAQFYLADSEYWNRDYAKAAEDFSILLGQYPGCRSVTAEYKKAVALLQIGETAEAKRQFRQVVRDYPDSVEALEAQLDLHQHALR
jgi:TolA-binding protein